MGFFDFLKKQELAEIERLKAEVLRLAKYQSIVDTESAIEARLKEFEQEKATISGRIQELKDERLKLSKQYHEAHEIYKQLQKEISLYQDTLDISAFGMYEPHFNYDDSELYKEGIIKVREKQKVMIKAEKAAIGGDNITLDGSLAKGQQFVKGIKKIMLRAFNGECDSFVANVDWKNINKMEERIIKSWEFVNKAYSKQGIFISIDYKDLKLEELWMAYEYQLKKHEEKEEQRAIKEQMREEEKARKEIETAIAKAIKEQEAYQKALDKARKEVEMAEGAKQQKLQMQIAELEVRLKEADSNKDRALSMAQQTKRGHVYVISNIGSFGENVYKIGMTRRLDPLDRVRELGDASVPFPFDVHAIIFSEDAPRLENELHKEFSKKRTNLVNPRKEFFNVTLEEIESIAQKNGAKIEFTKVAEARDYRESEAMRNKAEDVITSDESRDNYPRDLFEDDE